jgi:putative ABC transport system permease protein
MKYLPLVWAGLRRRPAHPILTAIAMAFAACLAGLTLGMARLLPPSGDLDLAVRAIAGIGFLLILFLTIHAVAQALRERGWEFALLRVLGFSRRLVLGLFFLEVASACLTGVMIGIALAQFLFFLVCHLIFPPMTAPAFLPIAVVGLDLAGAIAVAVVSTILPAYHLARLNLAAALARGGP